MNTLLKKASKKYQPLARMCNYMNKKKRRILINAFITCFLTAFLFECLIVGLRTTELIKFKKKLEDLPAKTKQISPLMIYWKIGKIHQTNLQILATEIYKKKNDLGREIMKHIFHLVQKPYDLRNDSILQRRRNFILYFGTESISSLAPKIWETAPCETKNAK